MVKSISALVWLPLSPYVINPADSIAIAASMMPIEGTLISAVRPLNSGSSSAFQCFTSWPIRSGRMPSVSAL
jgi:hypothetical protein